jgi:hypothetical protein
MLYASSLLFGSLNPTPFVFGYAYLPQHGITAAHVFNGFALCVVDILKLEA